jgi:hypothetical protein
MLSTVAWYVIIWGMLLSVGGAFMAATVARMPLGVLVGALGVVLGGVGGWLWALDGGGWKVFWWALVGLALVSVVGLGMHIYRRRKLTHEQRMDLEVVARFRERIK